MYLVSATDKTLLSNVNFIGDLTLSGNSTYPLMRSIQ
jgi:hypothetical protein